MAERQGVKTLSDLDVVEVSLVGSPANKRKFLLIKNEGGKTMNVELEEVRAEATEEAEISKALSEEGKNACKGAANLLGKIKDKDVKDIVTQLEELAGEEEKKDKEEYGYKKPEEKGKKEEEYGYKKPKTEKSDIEKKLDLIEKERDTLSSEVKALKKAEQKRELTEIAKSLEGKVEDTVSYLEGLVESLPADKFTQVVDREKLHTTRMKESELFSEKGKNIPSVSSAEAKLLQKAKEAVAKGADQFKAFDQVMRENPELYEEYRKETNRVERP